MSRFSCALRWLCRDSKRLAHWAGASGEAGARVVRGVCERRGARGQKTESTLPCFVFSGEAGERERSSRVNIVVCACEVCMIDITKGDAKHKGAPCMYRDIVC